MVAWPPPSVRFINNYPTTIVCTIEAPFANIPGMLVLFFSASYVVAFVVLLSRHALLLFRFPFPFSMSGLFHLKPPSPGEVTLA